ncbi:MAG: FixH family protein [Pseudomonadota bacterium]
MRTDGLRPEIKSDYTPGERPVTGRMVLLIVLAFFGVIIAANMTMLSAALSSFGGLVVKNSYVASQRFNEDVAANRSSALAQWQVEATPEAGSLVLRITDPNGIAIRGATLSGVFGRPTHERADQAVTFVERGDGLYQTVATPAPGAWRLVLSQDEDGTLRRRRFDLYFREGAF